MTDSDSPRRLVFEMPKRVGNKTSSVVLAIGPEQFECAKTIDGITLLEFAQLAAGMGDPDAIERGEEVKISPQAAAASSGAILDLLQACILEWDRFRAFVRENGIEIEDLAEYASGLVEQYTERPTPPPSES